MNKRPNDRVGNVEKEKSDDKPQIFVVVNEQEFVKPGLESHYAESKSEDSRSESIINGCSCNPYTGTVCSCNRVCTCNPLCSCQSHVRKKKRTCSCVGYINRGGGGRTYCSCVPVH